MSGTFDVHSKGMPLGNPNIARCQEPQTQKKKSDSIYLFHPSCLKESNSLNSKVRLFFQFRAKVDEI